MGCPWGTHSVSVGCSWGICGVMRCPQGVNRTSLGHAWGVCGAMGCPRGAPSSAASPGSLHQARPPWVPRQPPLSGIPGPDPKATGAWGWPGATSGPSRSALAPFPSPAPFPLGIPPQRRCRGASGDPGAAAPMGGHWSRPAARGGHAAGWPRCCGMATVVWGVRVVVGWPRCHGVSMGWGVHDVIGCPSCYGMSMFLGDVLVLVGCPCRCRMSML